MIAGFQNAGLGRQSATARYWRIDRKGSVLVVIVMLLLGVGGVQGKLLPPVASPEVIGPVEAGDRILPQDLLASDRLAPMEVWVDDDYSSGGANDGHTWQVDAFNLIQEAIDSVANGGTVYVAAGLYSQALNIDGRAGIAIIGAGNAVVTYRPSSTLGWNVGGYGTSRRAAVRVVGSTGIAFSGFTFDFNLVKGNNIAGVLYWDATGGVSGSNLINMSVPDASGGYYELMTYVRAPSYTANARASVAFVGNTFQETGRVGLVSHSYVALTISGNTFLKTTDDFGYAMEIGSQSSGLIENNVIHGYDTPAASDGSSSAGIYIENSFTQGVVGETKPVSLVHNDIYDCQWGLYIGNVVSGYAGDVDIAITMQDNAIHDNIDGGMLLSDEDRSLGSSVSVTLFDDTLRTNGDFGVFAYTNGDGDIALSATNSVVTGNGIGVFSEDYATGVSGSAYAITASHCGIFDNTEFGIRNDYEGFTIAATGNWWGSTCGPYHATNPASTANAVSDYVTFETWCNETFTRCDYHIGEGCTCCVLRGNIDQMGAVNVSDLTYLVSYLFRQGPAPNCLEEANVDNIDPVNVADLTFLVAYLFRQGVPPAPC